MCSVPGATDPPSTGSVIVIQSGSVEVAARPIKPNWQVFSSRIGYESRSDARCVLMKLTSQETENQNKNNMTMAEQISEECDVETFEFIFYHVKQTVVKCAILFNSNMGSHFDTGRICASPTFLTLKGYFLPLHGTIHLVLL
jgi:hypothetical protein